MEEFDDDLTKAGDALRALADGPGREAADALEAAFGRAGTRIEDTLRRAARSGELDFQRMAEGILRDLARIAAEAVIARAGGEDNAPQAQVNFNFAAGTDARHAQAQRGLIASTLTRLVNRGGRYQ